MQAARTRAALNLDDAALLAQCEQHIHRTGGPGGQHRNKVATAIRLVHKPSGIVVTAGETRSQQENRAAALRRLREAIAVQVRLPPGESLRLPESVQVRQGRLRVSEQNDAYPIVLALALDALNAHQGRPSDAAPRLGVTASSLTKFVAGNPRAWAELQSIRAAAGLSRLRVE